MTRKPIVWIGRSLLAILGLLGLILVSLLIFRPTLNLELIRPRIENVLTAQSGVPVTIRDLRLRTSLWPTVFARDVRIGAAHPESSTDIARITNLELQISLLPLLRQRLWFIKTRIEGVELNVEPALDLLGQDRSATTGSSDWALVGLRDFEGVDIVARHQIATDQSHVLDFASIQGGVSQTEPLELQVVGKLNDAALKIDLNGPPIANLFDPPNVLPAVVVVELGDLFASSHVAVSKAKVLLDDLQGQLDDSPFSGQLKLELSSDRPSISGTVALVRLRAGRWLPKEDPSPNGSADPDEPPDPQANPHTKLWPELWPDLRPELSEIEVPYHLLAAFNADLQLSLDGIDGLPLEVEQLTASLELRDGNLVLPIRFTVAGSQIEATAKAAAGDSLQEISLEVELDDFPLDRLAEVSAELAPISGRIGNLRISATTAGQSLLDLVEQSSVDLQSTQSSVRLVAPDFERTLDLDIAQMSVKRRPGKRLRIDMRGSFQKQPFRIGLQSKNLLELEGGRPWPIDLTLQSLGIEARLDATLTPTGALPKIDTRFRLKGERLSDLSAWLGISDEMDLGFVLSGNLLFGPTETRTTITEGRLGNSSFTADVSHVRAPKEHLQVDIDVAAIDLQELKTYSQPLEDRELAENSLTLDLPVLPKAIVFPDTDLHLLAEKVVRRPQDITDVMANLRFRDERLEPSTFSLRVGSSAIEGTVELYWDHEIPQIEIDLEGEQINLADLIEPENIGAGLSATAEQFEFAFKSQGSTLRDLLSLESDIELTGRGIAIKAPIRTTGSALDLVLGRLEVDAPHSQPLTSKASGRLNDVPVQLTMKATPEEGFRAGDDIPVDLIALFDDVRTELRGEIHFPFDLDKQQLELEVSAPAISSLNPILELDLPDVGPLSFKGSFKGPLDPRTTGFEIAIDEVAAGASHLSGTVTLDTSGERLRVDAHLASAKLQPGDFLSDKALAETDSDDEDRGTAEPRDAEPSDSDTGEFSEPLRFPQDLEVLRRFDGTLSLQVDEISWGDVTGGGGELHIQLEDGHLTIGPLRLEQTDSAVGLQGDLNIRDSGLDIDLGLRVDDFRYGPIAQAFNPEAEGDGTVTVDAALRSAGVTLEELVAASDGHFDFTLNPHGVDTRVLDLWATSIVSVLRVFNPNNESILNCITGRFSLDDGLMQADSFYLDTSQIRARGKGEVDLTDQTIQMKFRPSPKRRTFLNLATPVRVSGPLNDPNIRVAAGGLAGAAFRIYTWAVTVFFEVFRSPLPSDGSDICVAPVPRGEPKPGN